MVSKQAAASAENSVLTWAKAYEQAASQAVHCQTFPTPPELPDGEGVQTDQLTRLLGHHVRESAVPGLGQRAPHPLGQHPQRPCAVDFQHRQSLLTRLQAHPAQEPVHGAGARVQPPCSGRARWALTRARLHVGRARATARMTRSASTLRLGGRPGGGPGRLGSSLSDP